MNGTPNDRYALNAATLQERISALVERAPRIGPITFSKRSLPLLMEANEEIDRLREALKKKREECAAWH